MFFDRWEMGGLIEERSETHKVDEGLGSCYARYIMRDEEGEEVDVD